MAIFSRLRAAAISSSLVYFLAGLVFIPVPVRAVAVTSGYNTAAPTNSDIPNWQSGWASSGITGWDYVGQIGGASGVYLGNGWVLTAAHIGAGDFILDGTTYSAVSGSAVAITSGSNTADLTLFQISTSPDLPALTISTHSPTIASVSNPGGSVAMIGYGGGAESWGLNSVTAKNLSVTPSGYSYVSTDFETAYGTTAYGSTNSAYLVDGDSGGGDFIYNTSTNLWNLAGINEAVDGSNDSYMVQLSSYATKINATTGVSATPEPETWALLILGLTFLGYCSRSRGTFRL